MNIPAICRTSEATPYALPLARMYQQAARNVLADVAAVIQMTPTEVTSEASDLAPKVIARGNGATVEMERTVLRRSNGRSYCDSVISVTDLARARRIEFSAQDLDTPSKQLHVANRLRARFNLRQWSLNDLLTHQQRRRVARPA